MELHRLDGIYTTGLDNLDIQDIDHELVDEAVYSIGSIATLEGLGTIDNTEITHEILDEHGNIVMYADAHENLYRLNGLEGFFKKIGRGLKRAGRFVKKAVVRPVRKAVKFVGKKVVKPAFKFFNRFLNPATILLRNGFLLAMKLNLFKVAERLRFGYLSESEARKRGMSMSGFAKLKGIVRKAERIYEGAGGKKRNLKKAILKGKGNSNRAVPLNGISLGMLSENESYADDFERFVTEGDIEVIEEFVTAEEGIEIEGLGAVVSGTAIAAASGAVASVGKLLSKVTGVFDKAKKVKNQVNQLIRPKRSSSPSRPRHTLKRTTSFIPNHPNNHPIPNSRSQVTRSFNPQIKTTTVVQESFLKKHKTPLLIGAGILTAGGIIYAITRNKKREITKSVNGVPNTPKKRDALGRFTSQASNTIKRTLKKNTSTKRKTSKKFVPKVLL